MNSIKLLFNLITKENITNRLMYELNVYINNEDIMSALMEINNQNWDYDKIKKYYILSKEYKINKKIYELIEFNESIIVNHDNLIYFDECIKNNGEIWYIHKNDKDPFPSIPHAHNYDWQISMHLGNGCYYQGRKFKGKIKRKHLLEIRNKIKKITLPVLEFS